MLRSPHRVTGLALLPEKATKAGGVMTYRVSLTHFPFLSISLFRTGITCLRFTHVG